MTERDLTGEFLRAEGELAELRASLETLQLAIEQAKRRALAEPDSLGAAFFLAGLRTAADIMGSPSSDPPENMYDVARRVTDEVFGPGAYAKTNAGHPDPRVQAAIARGGKDTE